MRVGNGSNDNHQGTAPQRLLAAGTSRWIWRENTATAECTVEKISECADMSASLYKWYAFLLLLLPSQERFSARGQQPSLLLTQLIHRECFSIIS
jgi:hypothetical protein